MQTPLLPRPPLIPALDAVKRSGRCNMFDRTCVVVTMQDLGYTSQADWLSEHLDDYLAILIVEYSQWMKDNAPPPLNHWHKGWRGKLVWN